jgi:hypothetical protein
MPVFFERDVPCSVNHIEERLVFFEYFKSMRCLVGFGVFSDGLRDRAHCVNVLYETSVKAGDV